MKVWIVEDGISSEGGAVRGVYATLECALVRAEEVRREGAPLDTWTEKAKPLGGLLWLDGCYYVSVEPFEVKP